MKRMPALRVKPRGRLVHKGYMLHYHAPMLRTKTVNCATFNFRNFWLALRKFPPTVFSNQSVDDVKHSVPLQFSKDITAFH